jgi:hypothetical protein
MSYEKHIPGGSWQIFLFTLLSSLLLFSAAANAAATEQDVDESHTKISRSVQEVAHKIDSLFVSDRYMTWEENRTAITLRIDTDFIEHHGVDISPKFKLRLDLPRLKNFSLVANEDEVDGADRNPSSGNESDVALRWAKFISDKYGLSFDLGLRLRDDVLEVFGRLNTSVEYPLGGTWLGRSTNRLYLYSDAGWRNDYRQYFERRLGEDLFFRSRTRIQYLEEQGSRLYPQQKFTLFQRLSKKSVLAYEGVAEVIPDDDSPFDENEIRSVDEDYTRYFAQLRYRRNVWRPWLFIELWPGIGFSEEVDYDKVAFIRVRVDILFGYILGAKTSLEEE